MLMTRFGYHSLVIIWLGVLCLIDVGANTMMTGIWSDVYFYKVFLDGALIWWTVLFLREDVSGTIVSTTSSKAKIARADEPVVAVNLGAHEYVYYGFLLLYGVGNLYFHHAINKDAVGLMSIATLILSMVDVAVSAVAAVNLYHVGQGNFVKLQKTMQG